jgi:hypothetical protein
VKLPEDIRNLLTKRFHNKHKDWLLACADSAVDEKGEHLWPLTFNLGIPTEQNTLRQPEGVRAWVSAWQSWQGSGTLVWRKRHWRTLGIQDVPHKLILDSPLAAVSWIGETERWLRAVSRYQILIERWPALTETLPKHFNILADYSHSDFSRLIDMTSWICAHPNSNLYPRQIPLAGVHSKWFEAHSVPVMDLIASIQGPFANKDIYWQCGLKQLPQLICLSILDAKLREKFGGLRNISSPLEEISNLKLRPDCVFIVENLQSGLAFEDLPGTLVIMGLGYGVNILKQIPWLRRAHCFYWGDIDTHGFAILNLAKESIPSLESVLMDESTLLDHRELWVEEKKPTTATLPLLNDTEQELYQALISRKWGQQIRLEQERINWEKAWANLSALPGLGSGRIQLHPRLT